MDSPSSLRRSQRFKCSSMVVSVVCGYNLVWPTSCYKDSAAQRCGRCSPALKTNTSPTNDSYQPLNMQTGSLKKTEGTDATNVVTHSKLIIFGLWVLLKGKLPIHFVLGLYKVHWKYFRCVKSGVLEWYSVNTCSVATQGSYICMLVRFTVFPYRG